MKDFISYKKESDIGIEKIHNILQDEPFNFKRNPGRDVSYRLFNADIIDTQEMGTTRFLATRDEDNPLLNIEFTYPYLNLPILRRFEYNLRKTGNPQTVFEKFTLFSVGRTEASINSVLKEPNVFLGANMWTTFNLAERRIEQLGSVEAYKIEYLMQLKGEAEANISTQHFLDIDNLFSALEALERLYTPGAEPSPDDWGRLM